jgi:hypothetical protein
MARATLGPPQWSGDPAYSPVTLEERLLGESLSMCACAVTMLCVQLTALHLSCLLHAAVACSGVVIALTRGDYAFLAASCAGALVCALQARHCACAAWRLYVSALLGRKPQTARAARIR